jgi:predicted phage baseplate assembly protein
MPLPDPQLDDRHFQDIVNEAKGLIPHYAPEWTDHNLSDPGVTFIELFAYMTDMILYRLNRVPDKNYIRYMDLLGIRLKDAVPASTVVSFRLSTPQPGPVPIPRGTEVATVRTGEREAIPFTTDEELVILPPTVEHCLFSADGESFEDVFKELTDSAEQLEAFQSPPLPNNALHFGFPENLSSHILSLDLVTGVQGVGVDPDDPPLIWEAWCGDRRAWASCTLESDTTGGLNEPGNVVIVLPPGMEQRTMLRKSAFWVRLRVVQPRAQQPMYSASPRIDAMAVVSIGASIDATHSELIRSELLGRVTDAPGERFFLQNTPLLPRRSDELLEVEQPDGTWVQWTEVDSFRDSTIEDRHYTIDSVGGELSFGPRIRDADGTERAYGMRPARGSALRFSRYRAGGGIVGNVGSKTLTVLKSSIPYVASVSNRLPGIGGLDPESIESAKERTPRLLRSRDRAVTAEDYEFLAGEASPQVARAKAIAVRSTDQGGALTPGTVELLIVPALDRATVRTLEILQPPPDLLEEVRNHLDDRRMLGTNLAVDGPAYVGVSIEANVVVQPTASAENVRQRVHDRIMEYLDPLLGGPEGHGWPFGRDLYLSEIQSVVQSVAGVEYAQDVTLYQVDISTGQTRAAGQNIILADDVLLFSFEHTINATVRARSR